VVLLVPRPGEEARGVDLRDLDDVGVDPVGPGAEVELRELLLAVAGVFRKEIGELPRYAGVAVSDSGVRPFGAKKGLAGFRSRRAETIV
jgi:hypothetical protein